MTAACHRCGAVYWVVDGHRCSGRACASLPRRRASAAEIAALREDMAALDRGILAAAEPGAVALELAQACESRQDAQDDAWKTWAQVTGVAYAQPLRLLPGGAA
jgi:hypothetical protein